MVLSNAFGQDMLHGRWIISDVIGVSDKMKFTDKELSYNMYDDGLNKDRQFIGNIAYFNSGDQSFETFHTSFCGFGYFPSSYGKYKIIDGGYVELTLDSIVIHGYKKPKKIKKFRSLGLYRITRSEKEIHLSKVLK